MAQVKCILAEQAKGGSGSVSLISIVCNPTEDSKTSYPTNCSYYNGDTISLAGMKICANYGQGSVVMGTQYITYGSDTASSFTISPTIASDGMTSFTVTYTENGNSASCSIPITVTHTLSSIAITTNPSTTSYEWGSSFNTSGLVVTATYSDNTTANVTPASVSPASGYTFTSSNIGTMNLVVSYTEHGITKEATKSGAITINRQSVAKPTWKSSAAPTYSGSSINVASSTYWNNWNTTYFTPSGCSEITAGTHTATFTPTQYYRWSSDGSTSGINVDWTIKQKAPTFSLSSNTAEITASNYSSGVTITITYDGDGTLSVTGNVTGLTATLNSNTKTITITGNGSTATSATFTVSATAGTNYSAPTSLTISATASYWSFDGGETGDAAWWAGLYAKCQAGAVDTNWVGREVNVTLSSAVLGTTTHKVRCIGVNQDGSNTVTFQTSNSLATTTVFGTSSAANTGGGAYWGDSGCTAKTQCQNYYNAFPGKNYIKTVSKQTNQTYNSSSVVTSNETVWLPSIFEVGLGSYQYAPKASEYTVGGSQTAYSYYSDNSSRIKKTGDSGSANYWWTRSRNSNGNGNVCAVNSSGGAGYNGYNGSYGLAPAFVIG